MADYKYLTDPLIDLAVGAGGTLGSVLPSVGMFTPVKTLNDTMRGSKEPITEKNLTPEQQSFIRELIKFKEDRDKKYAEVFGEGSRYGKPNAITYSDYHAWWQAQPKDKRPAIMAQGLESMFSPYGQTQTTLGQFNYKLDPKTGAISLKDFYDFNNLDKKVDANVLESSYGPGYGAVREFAGRQVPEGTGRTVNINLTGLEPSIK